MTTTAVRRRLLVVVVVALALLALWPLLTANAAARQQKWEAACTSRGGAIRVLPKGNPNPLVVESGKPSYECRDVHGIVVSVRR